MGIDRPAARENIFLNKAVDKDRASVDLSTGAVEPAKLFMSA